MSAILRPTAAEARSNKTYEALLWALSRPGDSQTLALSGPDSVVEALCDQEVGVFSTDGMLASRLKRLGLRFVGLEQADYVVISGPLDADRAALLRGVKAGDRLYPENSATIIVEADLDGEAEFALSGPGINGRRVVKIGGIDPAFWALRAAACSYPLGWDAFLVDGTRVMGLPRSTNVEAL